MTLCAEHAMPYCRECNRTKKAPFGQGPRKPLKKSKPKRQKMSADAKVQDAMLGKGRCYVADGMSTDCTDGHSQRSHIVKQTVISDAFPYGAMCGLVWRPVSEDEPQHSVGASLFRPLQELLDDTRNIVPTCPNHNVDGLAMVEALGIVGVPDGFDDFCREYGFVFNGRYWTREVQTKPVVLDPRAAA